MARALEPEFIGRTYDDFLFRPQASPVGRKNSIHRPYSFRSMA
jgi:hypothetical protein